MNQKTKEIFEAEYNSDEDYKWIWDVVYKEHKLYRFFDWGEYVNKLKNPAIVNFGCGYGLLNDVLYEKYGSKMTVVGTELVKGKVHENKIYSVHQLDLDVDNRWDKIDMAICSHVLQYLKEPYKFLGNMLDHSNLVLIAVPLTKKPPESGMHYTFNYRELKKFIKQKGFKIKNKTYESNLYSGIYKGVLAGHARFREKYFNAKYRRRVYADTGFRKLILLTGLFLANYGFDAFIGYFQRSGVILLCERV